MKKLIKYLIVFMLSIFILVPASAAWDLQTHQNACKSYYSLPSNVQQKLNLNEMKKESIAPDATFHDNSRHVCPTNSAEAQKWLNKGKLAYKSKNYKYASYCFGVASHYTSDTFSAPHSTKATKAQHEAYKSQATSMT